MRLMYSAAAATLLVLGIFLTLIDFEEWFSNKAPNLEVISIDVSTPNEITFVVRNTGGISAFIHSIHLAIEDVTNYDFPLIANCYFSEEHNGYLCDHSDSLELVPKVYTVSLVSNKVREESTEEQPSFSELLAELRSLAIHEHTLQNQRGLLIS